MEERELSKLSYLTAAIAVNPSRVADILRLMERPYLIPPSAELLQATESIRKVTDKGRGGVNAMRDRAQSALRKERVEARRAGLRSFLWALDNYG